MSWSHVELGRAFCSGESIAFSLERGYASQHEGGQKFDIKRFLHDCTVLQETSENERMLWSLRIGNLKKLGINEEQATHIWNAISPLFTEQRKRASPVETLEGYGKHQEMYCNTLSKLYLAMDKLNIENVHMQKVIAEKIAPCVSLYPNYNVQTLIELAKTALTAEQLLELCTSSPAFLTLNEIDSFSLGNFLQLWPLCQIDWCRALAKASACSSLCQSQKKFEYLVHFWAVALLAFSNEREFLCRFENHISTLYPSCQNCEEASHLSYAMLHVPEMEWSKMGTSDEEIYGKEGSLQRETFKSNLKGCGDQKRTDEKKLFTAEYLHCYWYRLQRYFPFTHEEHQELEEAVFLALFASDPLRALQLLISAADDDKSLSQEEQELIWKALCNQHNKTVANQLIILCFKGIHRADHQLALLFHFLERNQLERLILKRSDWATLPLKKRLNEENKWYTAVFQQLIELRNCERIS